VLPVGYGGERVGGETMTKSLLAAFPHGPG